MPSAPVVPDSLAAVTSLLRPCFTAPSFDTFRWLVVGFASQVGERTVCGMWQAARLAGVFHHSRAHGFFTAARWSPDELGLRLAELLAARLTPAGEPLRLALDDTLFHRSGRKVFPRLPAPRPAGRRRPPPRLRRLLGGARPPRAPAVPRATPLPAAALPSLPAQPRGRAAAIACAARPRACGPLAGALPAAPHRAARRRRLRVPRLPRAAEGGHPDDAPAPRRGALCAGAAAQRPLRPAAQEGRAPAHARGGRRRPGRRLARSDAHPSRQERRRPPADHRLPLAGGSSARSRCASCSCARASARRASTSRSSPRTLRRRPQRSSPATPSAGRSRSASRRPGRCSASARRVVAPRRRSCAPSPFGLLCQSLTVAWQALKRRGRGGRQAAAPERPLVPAEAPALVRRHARRSASRDRLRAKDPRTVAAGRNREDHSPDTAVGATGRLRMRDSREDRICRNSPSSLAVPPRPAAPPAPADAHVPAGRHVAT